MKKFILTFLVVVLSAIMIVSIGSTQEIMASEFVGEVSAKSYIVLDDNGTVLVENNADDKKQVASICKLMTTLLTLEQIENGALSLDDYLFASQHASDAEGSQAFLDAGSKYSVRDLLKSVIVASANDSAIVLAEGIAGSEANFVTLMNEKAKSLGMKNTLYANATGLPAENQYSTARDTSIILDVVSDYEIYLEDCKIWMDELVHPSGRKTELVNTNRLIKYYPYCVCGKTGFTDEAGYCLASTAVNSDLKLTCVVLGCVSSADRFSDSVELYNYAYANFKCTQIISKDTLVDHEVHVSKGKEDTLELVYADDFYLTLGKLDKESFSLDYELPKAISAPILKGDIVGKVNIVIKNEIVGSVEIVAGEEVQLQTYKDVLNDIVNKFSFIN